MQQFQTILRFDTRNPPGNEHLVADYLKGVFDKAGIPAQIFALDPNRSNVVARLKGNGKNTAWLWVREIFGWRRIRNRRELASLAGLTPSPYDSGETRREQGISKAGNRRVRWMMIELAWLWLRYQPDSELSRWFRERFGAGNSRARKTGIVAVARELV